MGLFDDIPGAAGAPAPRAAASPSGLFDDIPDAPRQPSFYQTEYGPARANANGMLEGEGFQLRPEDVQTLQPMTMLGPAQQPTDVLRPSDFRPSLGARFDANANEAARNTSGGALADLITSAVIGREANGDMRRREEAAYEAMPGWNGPAEAAAALGGQLFGGAPALENFIALPAKLAAMVPGKGTAVGRVVEHGAGGAFGNAVSDPAVQGAQMAAGTRDEYSPEQTAMGALLGFGIGGGVRVPAEVAGWLRGRAAAKANKAPAEVTPDDVRAVLTDEDVLSTLKQSGLSDRQIAQFSPEYARRLAEAGDAGEIGMAGDAADAFALARRKQEKGVFVEQAYPRERTMRGRDGQERVLDAEGRREDDILTGRRVIEATERDRGMVDQPQVVQGSGGAGLPVPTEAPVRGMAPDEVARARAQMEGGNRNNAEGMARAVAPEGGLPRTPGQVQQGRDAEGAFRLAERQRDRASADVRDTQPPPRPEGVGAQTIHLDDDFPVEILGRRFVPDAKGRMVEVARVRRYDPRTGEAATDAVEYEVPVRQLRASQYADEPRMAQDFGTRAEGPTRPETPRMPGEDVGYEPEQTYRTTGADPNEDFPGAGSGRSPLPDQPDGPGPWRERPRSEEEILRQFEEAERRRKWREEQARANGGYAEDDLGSGSAKRPSGKSSNTASADADGRFAVDDDGLVRSSKGGPVIFGDQKQAAKWILNVGHKTSPDQIFEIANHPSGKGYTVRERGRAEGPRDPSGPDGGQRTAPGRDASAESAVRREAPQVGEPRALPGPARAEAAPSPERGPFGPVYREFTGKPDEAVAHLLKMRDGEVPGALHHEATGPIDLVWGKEGSNASDGYGLSKIARWHPEVLDNLQGTLDQMEIVSRSNNRVNLESLDHRAAVRLQWDGNAKTWLLTEFRKARPDSVARTTDIRDLSRGDDTAPPTTGRASENVAPTTGRSKGEGFQPDPTLPPPALPPRATRVNQGAGTQRDLEASLNRADATRNQPRLDRAQTAAAEAARANTLHQIDRAAGSDRATWEAKADTAREAAANELDRLSSRAARQRGDTLGRDYRQGWDERMRGEAAPDQQHDRYARRGYDEADAFLRGNPRPEGPDSVRVTSTTARGRQTSYDLPNNTNKLGDVRERLSKLPADRFYANPLDPELFKQVLLDPAVKALRRALRGEISGFEKGLNALKDPRVRNVAAAGSKPDRLTVFEALGNNARLFVASNRGHFKAMLARYDGSEEITAAVREMADRLGTDPGSGRLVRQTYEEAVEQRSKSMGARLRNVLADHLDDQETQDIARDLLTGVRHNAPAAAKRVAESVRKLLDEQRDYVAGRGVEIGKRANYFPRIVSEVKVLSDQAGFLARAEEAYRADGLDAATAKEAAQEWLNRILGIGSDEHGTGPTSRHTKGRELGARADEILKDYYETDLVPALTTYFHQTSRLAEFTDRFGKNGTVADELFDRMRAGGMKSSDVAMLRSAWESSTGRVRTNLPDAVLGLSQWVSTMGNVALLTRAVLSSIAEPLTVGVRTGNVADGLIAFADTIGAGLKSKRTADAREIAEGLGIIGDAVQQMILAQRWGGGMSDRHGLHVGGLKITPARINAEFFRKVFLVGLTEAQRTATTRVGQGYLGNLLKHADTAERGASARALLAELGISADDAPRLRAWLEKGPSSSEIVAGTGDEAKLYRAALSRFVDECIQNPKAVDRPILANFPVARMMYGITSFTYAYWRNVTVRSAKVLRTAATGTTGLGEKLTPEERIRALGVAPAMLVMLAGQMAVSNAREGIFNSSADKERKKEPIRGLLLHADRANMFGAASPILNAVLSVRYERDLANLLLGPGAGYALQNAQKIVGLMPEPFGKNSPNTNTAEWNATQAGYRLFSPVAAAALTLLPGGPALNALTGTAMMAGTSPEASTRFANSVVGEKNKRGGGPWAKSGSSAWKAPKSGAWEK